MGCHCLLQMPFSRSLVFLGKELVHSSGAPNFVTVAQGTPLDHLALADSGTYVCSPQDWKRSVFIPIPKKGNAKECSNYHTVALISHANKLMLKILQARLQQYVNRELPDVQASFRKGRGTREEKAMAPHSSTLAWKTPWTEEPGRLQSMGS